MQEMELSVLQKYWNLILVIQWCLDSSKGDIAIVGDNGTQVAFKNCAPFTNYITKITGTTIDGAEDLDLVMPMYNLLE